MHAMVAEGFEDLGVLRCPKESENSNEGNGGENTEMRKKKRKRKWKRFSKKGRRLHKNANPNIPPTQIAME